MKKAIFIAASVLCATIAFAGGKAETKAAPTAQPINLKAYVPTNPTAVPTKALMYFAENVNKAAGGRLNVQVFHSGQLGNDREAIESTRMGTIDIMFAGTGGYSSFYKKAKIFDLPFLFSNAKEAYEVVNGPVGEDLFSGLKEFNLIYLSTGDNGMRHISTTGKAVNSVEDVKGLKVRVPEIDTYVALWKSWGAIVTPMPLGELYMALKTGVVDAQDNAPYHSVANKMHEVQKAYSMINYMWMGLTMVANDKSWAKLPADLQKIVKDEAKKAAAYSFDQIEKDNVTALATMKAAGLTIVDNPDRESFMKNIDAFYAQYEGQPWYDKALVQKLRKK
ncbi:MAG: TRAP transporter substrate-binding protein [Treponemataceae bacterium]